MPTITADNKDVEVLLTRLCEMVVDAGSYIHPDIAIRDHKGATSLFIKDPTNPPQAPYVKLSHNAAIPYDNFDFDIEGETLVIAHHDRNENPLHLELMQTLVEFYNISGKFKAHLQDCIWLSYAQAQAALDHILAARVGPDIELFKTMIADPDLKDELTLWTFFKSRILESALFKKDAQKTRCLVPILEFFNHTVFTGPFRVAYDQDANTGFSLAGVPGGVNESGECFASYARFDALDMLIHYNFADLDTPFLRSIPLKLNIDHQELGTTHIHIRGNSGFNLAKNLPESLQSLAFYAPPTTMDVHNKNAVLGHLIIPGDKAPRSMRRILAHVLHTLHPDAAQDDIQALVFKAEEAIIQANEKYFARLADKAQSIKNDEEIQTNITNISSYARRKLDDYKKFVRF